MRRWFDMYATDYDDSSTSSRLGGGWKWPTLNEADMSLFQDEDVSRHSVFRLLFEDDSESQVPEIILKTIRENWEIAESGIILGHERFDKVGETPHTHMDALKVIHRIVEDLSVPHEDVTIVLMYRTPRLQQWLDIYDTQSRHDDYLGFVCEDDEADKRLEYISTSMNIGLISKDYLQNGFNVVIVDEEGTQHSNLDLSHTVACDVLEGVECTHDGWVVSLQDATTQVDKTNDSQYQDVADLSLEPLRDLESLLLERECAFQAELQSHDRFRILNQKQMYSRCELSTAREKLMDPRFMIDFIQTQKGCGTGAVQPAAASNTPNQKPSSGGRIMGKYLLILLLLLLVVSGTMLAYILYHNHRKEPSEGESDGLFQNASPRNCFFRKRRHSESSTEGSTDEESSPPSPVKDIADVSLEDNTSRLSPSLDLCKACKLVRLDPNCPYCHGGQPRSHAAIKSEKDSPSWFEECEDVMSWEKDGNSVVSLDDFNLGCEKAQVSSRKSKKSIRSRAFRKLKELARLKNDEKSEDGEIVLNPSNLQMDRDDESVISSS